MVCCSLPSVSQRLKLDRHCPDCFRSNGTIHSGLPRRSIRDTKASWVPYRRMKCPWCGRTWTLRAEGIGPGRQRSDRLIILGVLGYMLGMSCRHSGLFLAALDCPSSKSSIEREVAEAGEAAQRLHQSAQQLQVRALGVDGTGAALAGRRDGVVFFVDVDGRRLLRVVWAKETESGKVRRPGLTQSLCELILRLARETAGWGVRRIVGEPRKLALKASRIPNVKNSPCTPPAGGICARLRLDQAVENSYAGRLAIQARSW